MATVINPSVKRITDLYEQTIEELLDYLTTELSADLSGVADYKKQAEVITRIEQMIAELKMWSEHEVSKEITAVFEESKQQFITEMTKQGLPIPEVNGGSLFLDEKVIKQLVADTMTDLAAATDMTEMFVKRKVREVFEERLALGKAKMLGREQIAKEIAESLSKAGLDKSVMTDGFIGIIDKSGKKWNLKTYVDTVVKTKLMDANNEAARVEGLQSGVDLAVISQHGSTDECAKWENVIISMNGMTEGFPLYTDIKATNECFHPKCQHHLKPVRNLDLISDRTKGISEKKMQDNWETLKK